MTIEARGRIRRWAAWHILLTVLACGMAAGSRQLQEQGAASAPSATAAGQERNTVRPAIKWKRFNYICEGEAKVTVYLHNATARVSFQDHMYMMRQTVSADGNRYSDGTTVWWGKGQGGFLQEDAPDGDGKMLVKDCVLEKPAAPDTVSGTITYLTRMALPPQATIEVQLLDTTLQDTTATVIAEEKFELGNRQVPVPFTLKYNPGKIDGKHAYSVSARIVIGTILKFVSDQAYPVITGGHASKVDLILKPVETPKS